MSYNGWTNYETWNVALWIGNDEGLYNCYQEILANMNEEVTSEDVQRFYTEYMGATTPDLEPMQKAGEQPDPINFDEIAEHWELERLEMQDE